MPSIEFEPKQIKTEKQSVAKTRLSLKHLMVYSPVIALSILVGGCDLFDSNTDIPRVKITDESDRDGDGIFTITDARLQKGPNWLPGSDVNFNSRVDGQDRELVLQRVGTSPPVPQFNIDTKNGISCADVEVLDDHLGEEYSDEPESNVGLDKLMLGGWFVNQMVIRFEPKTGNEKILSFVEGNRGLRILSMRTRSDDKNIEVIAQIPDEILDEKGLGLLIEEVRQEEGVAFADRNFVTIPNDTFGSPQECP